ncbi:MAG: TrpB-like pyridoxal phosphate-dependent enzyme [Candidatus Margulisbacteria bacterium]|jgi:tryptophan synthase beta chain|nr:TrpB-like pyridoxal phosphate-dependent enzyme [Candidatus Margulisiibacteriota bacterium]
MNDKLRKVILAEKDLPTSWYNIAADFKTPLPAPLNPLTKKPVGPADLAPLFPAECIKQEVSAERYIEIPEEVQDKLKLYRPVPLFRALELEKALDTPARIYYKYEGLSPSGSHKSNTAIAQAFYNKKEGTKRIATETGAGQWGSALCLAGALFGLEIKVYMVKVSYNQKPLRRLLMETWGGKVVASPSPDTEYGRAVLAKDPQCEGSLGMAISEAVADALQRDDTKYSLGSVLNHVILHQTIIGLETQKQLEICGEQADIVIACHGGGSNFGGFASPFIGEKLRSGARTRCIAIEPFSCPSLTKGKYAYDFGDTAGMTPIMMMHTLGHDYMPPGIHAGGLRYHGSAPLVSHMLKEGLIEARAVHQKESFDAAVLFAKTEGFLPAPESSHAIRGAIDEALQCQKAGEQKTIVFNLTGHGYFDMAAYEKYLNGRLEDHEYPAEAIAKSLAKLPAV